MAASSSKGGPKKTALKGSAVATAASGARGPTKKQLKKPAAAKPTSSGKGPKETALKRPAAAKATLSKRASAESLAPLHRPLPVDAKKRAVALSTAADTRRRGPVIWQLDVVVVRRRWAVYDVCDVVDGGLLTVVDERGVLDKYNLHSEATMHPVFAVTLRDDDEDDHAVFLSHAKISHWITTREYRWLRSRTQGV
jgi:hypothetical protein